MKIAMIPARGGSKRIPKKNIKDFSSKPMIAYAIEAACESGLFNHVIVSTDDSDISDIAIKYGAEVPFVRPDDLACDYTPTVPVVAHAIQFCETLGWEIEAVCCIYPGVPFLQANDLRDAWALLQETNSAYAFPITEYPAAIQRAFSRDESGVVKPFFPEFELSRTQDLELAYHDAGQFYWGWRNSWFEYDRIHSSGVGLPIPNYRVVDIDTPEDWIRAELLYKSLVNI